MLIPILLTICCVIIDQIFLAAMHRWDYVRAALWKTLASLCFLGVGFFTVFLATASDPVHTKIFIGLACGLVGDVLLALGFVWPERHDPLFVTGAGVFAVGHVFYLIALFALGAKVLIALPFWLVGLALSAWFTRKKGLDAGPLLIPGAGYIALVVAMGAAACSLFLARPGVAAALFALGGILFSVSDNLLCVHKMGAAKAERYNRYVHYTYYAAQLMIAWSVMGL